MAPNPGETKVWQYITLMKRIHLIDCPGVVWERTRDSDVDSVLKGVVRVERLDDATDYITSVLRRVKREYVQKAYRIKDWTDTEDFLTQLSVQYGKLLKGGDADQNTTAKMIVTTKPEKTRRRKRRRSRKKAKETESLGSDCCATSRRAFLGQTSTWAL